jgi:acyl dehydratase
MDTLWFEDYDAGFRMTTARRTVTEYDILSFVTLGGFHEALFLDEDYLREQTEFGARIAPGALVFSYAEGLVIQTGYLAGSAIAFLSASLDVKGPVKLGDTIGVEVAFNDKRLARRGDRGVVTTSNVVRNQAGTTVLEYTASRLIRTRPA